MPDPSTISGLAVILLGGSILLGVLVFIHEAGHYLVAKALGIRVEVFSLGFGPRLTGFHRGGTEYRVSAIPLGGYVKMLGENPDEALRGSKEEFLSRSKLERFVVLVMGATLNIVLAIVLTAGVYMYGVTAPLYVTQPPVIGYLDPNAAAAEAGLRVRDEILAVGDRPVHTWKEMHIQVALNPNKELEFKVRREGQVIPVPVNVRATAADRIGFIGIAPLSHYAVAAVTPGSAAENGGLRAGDEIISVAGRELFLDAEQKAFVNLVASGAGQPLAFKVKRGGVPVDLTVTPALVEGKGELGIQLGFPEGLVQYPPVEAVTRSLHDNWEQAGLLMVSLKKLVTREMSPKTLSGP
ncbi:MAG TPA: RIP metalloprotease RseP, partial [Candidatus Polarisedimenticolia bacterium]